MRSFIIKPGDLIPIGRAGENQATEIRFDVTGWAETFGAGTFELIMQRPGDSELPYPVEVTVDGDYVVWTVSNVDTGIAGNCKVQLRYVVSDAVAKSVIYRGIVGESLDHAVDPPDPYDDLIERIEELARQTEQNAESASRSAGNASDSADAAGRSATNAADSATQAGQSANGAAQSATDANAAKLASQAAQQHAEAAQAGAEAAEEQATAMVPGVVTSWLNEHVDPATGYVIDDSLTVQNAAADAKAVGDAIDDQKEIFLASLDTVTATTENEYIRFENGIAGVQPKSLTIGDEATKLFVSGKNISGGDAWFETGSGTVNRTNRTVSGASTSASMPQIAVVSPTYKYKEKTPYTLIITGKTTATAHNSTCLVFQYTDGTSTELLGLTATKSTLRFVSDPSKTLYYIGRAGKSGTKTFYVDECGLFEGDLPLTEFEPYRGKIYTVADGETNEPVKELTGTNVVWTYGYSTVVSGEFYLSSDQSWIRDKFDDVDSALHGVLYPDVVSLHSDSKAKATTFKIQRTTSEQYGNASLKLLFFTDVHNDTVRVGRAVELMNAWGSGYVDVAVNGGDTTSTIFNADQFTAYDAEIASSEIPVLNAVGNHDVYSTLDGARPLVNQVTAYNAITAKVKENVPAIVQPDGAASSGINYYYYDVGSIRIVVLDCMYWDSAELTWFESVLADAATNAKPVVAVAHYNFESTEVDSVDCIWNATGYGVGGSSSYPMPIAAAEAVKTFQDNGGEFVIWLCGHSHGDAIKKLKPQYGNQFELICPSFVNRAGTVFKSDNLTDYNYDCLTYIVVDTYYKIVRGMRIGANINEQGAEYHTFSIKYDTGTFLSAN